VLTILVGGCLPVRSVKFTESEWGAQGDCGTWPHRLAMIDDLRSRHSVLGLKLSAVRARLGNPDAVSREPDLAATWSLAWEGRFLDPDPVSGTDYVLFLDKDSVAIKDTVLTWDHGH
jgi:hypothetical protein